MDVESPRAGGNTSTSTEPKINEPNKVAAALDDPAPLDAPALVAKMVEAGEWPEPEILEQIVAAGDAAVEPLIAILRSKPRGWDEETPLYNALQLLESIHAPAAKSALIEIIKSYDSDILSAAARALTGCGADAFELLLERCRDRSFRGYRRAALITAARDAAGDDQVSRARLADVMRSILAEMMERLRTEKKNGSDEDPLDHEDPEDVESADEPSVYEEIAFVIEDLAGIADPMARDLIRTAFDENMVETYVIGEQDVEELYETGGDSGARSGAHDWLRAYRKSYDGHLAAEERVRERRPIDLAQLQDLPLNPPVPAEPEKLPIVEPIRNNKAKRGRNDPCWCGSGKKYKKCHFGTDVRV
jgi:hypothetical protein